MLDETRREDPWPGGECDPVVLARVAVEWGLVDPGELERMRVERRDVPLPVVLAGAGIDREVLLRLAQEVRSRTQGRPDEPPRLARYEILDTIGRGGMGRVVRARDRELGRIVALKILERGVDDDEGGRRRFLREARAVAKLSHPNVVGVHDVGEVEGRAFLVMELVAGGAFDERLAEPYEIDEMAARLAKVGRAVEAAHEAGIVHRDLKPGN